MGAGKDPAREAFKIEARNAVPEPNEPVTLEEVHSLLREEMADETAMTLLKGFKLDFSGTGDFHKVFFSVKCDCGTAGLLSVEVAKSKTPSQLKVALPGLMQHLKSKGRSVQQYVV